MTASHPPAPAHQRRAGCSKYGSALAMHSFSRILDVNLTTSSPHTIGRYMGVCIPKVRSLRVLCLFLLLALAHASETTLPPETASSDVQTKSDKQTTPIDANNPLEPRPLSPPPSPLFHGGVGKMRVSHATSVKQHIEEEAIRKRQRDALKSASGEFYHNITPVLTANGRLADQVYPMDRADMATAVVLTLVCFMISKFWGQFMMSWCMLAFWLRNIYGASEQLYETIIVCVAIVLGTWQLLRKSLI